MKKLLLLLPFISLLLLLTLSCEEPKVATEDDKGHKLLKLKIILDRNNSSELPPPDGEDIYQGRDPNDPWQNLEIGHDSSMSVTGSADTWTYDFTNIGAMLTDEEHLNANALKVYTYDDNGVGVDYLMTNVEDNHWENREWHMTDEKLGAPFFNRTLVGYNYDNSGTKTSVWVPYYPIEGKADVEFRYTFKGNHGGDGPLELVGIQVIEYGIMVEDRGDNDVTAPYVPVS